MGCDIHIAIQRKETDGWREITYQDEPYDFQKEKGVTIRPGIPVAPAGFHDRNYDLFGILADVRNGSGFAGVTTGEGWPSIAPGRGWPEGFNEESGGACPNYPEDGPRYMGDHSFTWVGLDELKAFNWDGIGTTLYGVVSAAQYENMMPGEKPTAWCGGVSGKDVQVYDRPGYLEAKRMNRLAKDSYVRIAWQESARSATGDWPGTVIPWLEQLAEGKPLRLIIGFDS